MADTLEQLIESMSQDLDRHRTLAQLLDNKLDAMRRHDISRLESLGVVEHRLLNEMRVGEKKRTQAARQATSQFCPRHHGPLATAREIALAATEPARTKILSLAALLREVAEKIQTVNRVIALAGEKIQQHFDHIFGIIARSGCDIGLYSQAGQKSLLEQNRLVDALA